MATRSLPPQAVDSTGRPIILDALVGRGGEGSVFRVRNDSSRVVKIYHSALSQDRQAKLATMVALQSDRLLRLTAWPVATVHQRVSGPVTGILMPRISGEVIHRLYSPKSRLAAFPNANWPFLIHAAGNLARSFAVIHAEGHVIGDVNHANALVSPSATVGLIDCDSFQVAYRERRFLCEVGISTHTPPELQGRPFNGVVRTANHDAFGLAILVFQLLFMGRHPFSGAYLGPGDMPLERAIAEFRFAYGARAQSRQMRQPPGTLPLAAVSAPLADLFERAFGPDGARSGRPLPQEWINALEGLSKSLKVCGRNGAHHYLRMLPSCPWCEVEARSGTTFFSVLVLASKPTPGTFDIEAVWLQIAAVSAPSPARPLPSMASFNVTPSTSITDLARKHRRVQVGGGVAAAVVSVIVLGFPTKQAELVWLLVIVIIAAAALGRLSSRNSRREADETLWHAQTELAAMQKRWNKEAEGGAFAQKKRDLEQKRDQYKALQPQRERRLKDLLSNRERRQLQMYLSAHLISRAAIPGIGPARAATLQSYGIETAADVSENGVMAVPGFGPATAQKLMDWRRSVERRFTFDPRKSVDPAEIAAVEQELARVRLPLERALLDGPQQLRHIAQQTAVAREILHPVLVQALRNTAQAEADVRAFRLF